MLIFFFFFLLNLDAPAEPRCIQTVCTSANTNHHTVTDFEPFACHCLGLDVFRPARKLQQPGITQNNDSQISPFTSSGTSNLTLEFTPRTRCVCTDVPFTRVREKPKTAQFYPSQWRIRIHFMVPYRLWVKQRKKLIKKKNTFPECSQRLR